MRNEQQNQPIRKAENFLEAELDIVNSSYKMLLFREGYQHPNTYYSKKKHFEEPQDKEYLMLSMIERFIGKNNCFFREKEEKNGKMYSPATMIEFWRSFQDDTKERLVLRMFHPTKNQTAFHAFDYLLNNEKVITRLNQYYELMRVGKLEAIGDSKPRRLEKDELVDFFWNKTSLENFEGHLAHLYTKYPARGRIDIYKENYLQRHYSSQSTILHPQKELTYVWAKGLEIIRNEIDKSAFLTWFAPIQPLKLENKKLILQVPSLFYHQWIEENYVDLMRKVLDQTIGKEGTLEYQMVNHK